jgi:hypothetical protein
MKIKASRSWSTPKKILFCFRIGRYHTIKQRENDAAHDFYPIFSYPSINYSIIHPSLHELLIWFEQDIPFLEETSFHLLPFLHAYLRELGLDCRQVRSQLVENLHDLVYLPYLGGVQDHLVIRVFDVQL